jgi:hypothetical protein
MPAGIIMQKMIFVAILPPLFRHGAAAERWRGL